MSNRESTTARLYAPPFDGCWSRFVCPIRLDAIKRLGLPFTASDADIYLAIMAHAHSEITRLDNKLAHLTESQGT